MRILLVSLTKDFLRAAKPHKPKGTIFLRFPSLALANIAALTPKEDRIIVADEQISPINYDIEVDLVAISVNTSIAERAYEIADRFRKKGVKVVFGGLHPSLMPDESLKHADSIIIGDADGMWEKMLKDLKAGKLKKRYINDQKRDLGYLPIPKWEIFKGMGYVNTNFVETSRGCPHHCRFCSTSPFYHHRHRTRPIQDVIRDINNVKSFPKKFIFFVDDNIIGDREYAKKLFKALIPLKIYWISQATADIGEDEELVRLAAKSGCFGLFLGFESISKANLDDMGKGHNHIAKYKKSIATLHKHGIGIEAGFIFGFDKDDRTVFRHTLDFLNDTKTDSFLAIYLTPIPGTVMHKEFRKQKRIISDDYPKYDFRHIVFKPKNMTAQEVYDGVSWITRRFYSKKAVIRRLFYRSGSFLSRPSIRRLLGVIGLVAISVGFRKRIKDLSKDGTFPRSFRNI
ncbi:radical SAM protein [Candidatus Woesearchaeota archaeon]|nr:radical SAM protein [Candidatus Woesearchaeota archaeon]